MRDSYLNGHGFSVTKDTAQLDDRLHTADGAFNGAIDHFLPAKQARAFNHELRVHHQSIGFNQKSSIRHIHHLIGNRY